jgi:putative endonuclease
VPEYFCYIIECADGSFYTGWSTNPIRRLKEHSAGRGARYTRARRPLQLVYTERHLSNSFIPSASLIDPQHNAAN